MKCALCQNKITVFNSKKIMYGRICLDCHKTLPSVVYLKGYEAEELIDIRDYMNANDFNDFEVTSSVGTLHIDETHGYICFSNKIVDGKPVNRSSIFSVLTLKEFNIYVGAFRRRGKNCVCDINCMGSIADTKIKFKKTIKSNVPCEYKKINENTAECIPPNDIDIFRNLIQQSLTNQLEGMLPLFRNYNANKPYLEMIAQHTLLLEDGYTNEDLKRHRNILLKAFHPDNGGNNEAIDKITAAYKLLSKQDMS